MSNLPAKQQFDVATYVEKTIKPKVIALLPRQEADWPAFQVAMLAAVLDKPGLRKVIADNPESCLVAVLKCARLGLSLNPIDKHFALVPRGGAIQGEPQYQGWAHLVMASGAVEWLHADVVYKQEIVDLVGPFVDPITQRVNHAPREFQRDSWKDDDIVGAYATMKLWKQDRLKTRVLSRSDINKRRAKGAGGSEAWANWFATMCKAKATKSLCSAPDVPRSRALNDALQLFREDGDPVPGTPIAHSRATPVPDKTTAQILFDAADAEPFPTEPDLATRLRSVIQIESGSRPPEEVAALFAKALGRPFRSLTEVTDTDELQKMFDAVCPRAT